MLLEGLLIVEALECGMSMPLDKGGKIPLLGECLVADKFCTCCCMCGGMLCCGDILMPFEWCPLAITKLFMLRLDGFMLSGGVK